MAMFTPFIISAASGGTCAPTSSDIAIDMLSEYSSQGRLLMGRDFPVGLMVASMFVFGYGLAAADQAARLGRRSTDVLNVSGQAR